MVTSQARWWLLTIPAEDWSPNTFSDELPPGISYVKGQKESGNETGFIHWQVVVCFKNKCTRRAVKSVFGDRTHCEPTRSPAARDYVWKEDTRVAGSQFEFGSPPHRRNCATDWQEIWNCASAGRLLDIEVSVRIQHYSALRRIVSDYARAGMVERTVTVFIGKTGTGKSHRAWEQAGLEAYPKGPTTKFWDGYHGQRHGNFN